MQPTIEPCQVDHMVAFAWWETLLDADAMPSWVVVLMWDHTGFALEQPACDTQVRDLVELAAGVLSDDEWFVARVLLSEDRLPVLEAAAMARGFVAQ